MTESKPRRFLKEEMVSIVEDSLLLAEKIEKTLAKETSKQGQPKK